MTTCTICQARSAMYAILELIDTKIPAELAIAPYDEAMAEVYNAADNAKDTLKCYCATDTYRRQ